jgi:hypothetical protein
MAARLLYLTLTRMLSWLALLCHRRSTLIAETLTLRHEVSVLVGAENSVTSCILHVFVYESAEPVST